MQKLKSTQIYMEDGVKSGVLSIENGTITDFQAGAADSDAEDFGNLRIIPGIFDTHNHGTCGYSMMPEDGMTLEQYIETVKGYSKALASQGTVNIFPTTFDLKMMKAIAKVAQDGSLDGAKILGIHSEGPWLARTGEGGIRTPWPEVSVKKAQEMTEAAGGLLHLVALAPEIPGIEAAAEYFLSQGISLANAHSDNTYAAAKASYEQGFSVATHLGNVMVDLHHRDVGGVGAALLNDNVMCEVICDGMHICNEMLRLYFRMKKASGFMLISDCTAMSGAPIGRYDNMFDGLALNVTEEGFVLTDTGRLLGSSQPVLYDIANLVEKVGIPLETCLQMACLNPSKKYGFDVKKGSLAIGKDADLVIISDDYKALVSFSEGRRVYDREREGIIFNERFLKKNR